MRVRDLRTESGSFWVGAVVSFLLVFSASLQSSAQNLYNINFNQLTAGSFYTNASGPPNDFSSFFLSGSNTSGVNAYIFPAFGAHLTNQPLVCNNAGNGVGNFVMQTGNLTSNIVTLTMQLVLDSSVGAQVSFGQSVPGASATSVILTFPDSATSTVQVQSVDGATNAPTVLYSLATTFIRTNLQNISFTLNQPAHTFSVVLNGVALANNAPFGSGRGIDEGTIGIGDVSAIGTGGNGAIDNILLTSTPGATISNIFVSGANVFVSVPTSSGVHYDVQSTTDLVSGPWVTIFSNVPGIGGLTNFNCGSSQIPQEFFRVCAHP